MKLCDLMEASDGAEEETELLDDQQLSVFQFQTDLVTRKHTEACTRRVGVSKIDNVVI